MKIQVGWKSPDELRVEVWGIRKLMKSQVFHYIGLGNMCDFCLIGAESEAEPITRKLAVIDQAQTLGLMVAELWLGFLEKLLQRSGV